MTRSAYKKAEADEANIFVNVIQNNEESKSQGKGQKDQAIMLMKQELE